MKYIYQIIIIFSMFLYLGMLYNLTNRVTILEKKSKVIEIGLFDNTQDILKLK